MTGVSLDFRPMAALRRRCGTSQAAVAAYLGVCPSTVSHWERNVRGVSAENLFALAQVMGCPVWQLCTVTEENGTPVRLTGAEKRPTRPGKAPSGATIHPSASTTTGKAGSSPATA